MFLKDKKSLFVSGYDDEYTLGAIKDPGCDGFYRKGRPTQELREWIHYLITPEELRPKTPPVRQAPPVFQRRDGRLRASLRRPLFLPGPREQAGNPQPPHLLSP